MIGKLYYTIESDESGNIQIHGPHIEKIEKEDIDIITYAVQKDIEAYRKKQGFKDYDAG